MTACHGAPVPGRNAPDALEEVQRGQVSGIFGMKTLFFLANSILRFVGFPRFLYLSSPLHPSSRAAGTRLTLT